MGRREFGGSARLEEELVAFVNDKAAGLVGNGAQHERRLDDGRVFLCRLQLGVELKFKIIVASVVPIFELNHTHFLVSMAQPLIVAIK